MRVESLPEHSADSTVQLSILWEAVERGSGSTYHIGHGAIAATWCAVVEMLTDVCSAATGQSSPNARLSLLSGTAQGSVTVLLFLLVQQNTL